MDFRIVLLRRFPEALRKFDQALNITPDDVDVLVEKAGIAQAEGDLPRASALLFRFIRKRATPTSWKHWFTKPFWSAALHRSFPG